MRVFFTAALLLWCGGAGAQQADPAELVRRIAVIEAQRNQALGWHAASESARAGLAEDLARAQARIKELEPKKPDDTAKEAP